TVAQRLLAEARGHHRVSRLALLDVQMLGIRHGYETGPEGARGVIDVAEAIGILEVGGARGDVRHHDGPTVADETLGERGSEKRAPCRLAHPLAKLRLGHGETHQSRPFVEDHGVAEETMPAGMTARGDGGGGGA